MFRGRLISRYKRFFADIELDGQQDSVDSGKLVTSHCPNTGSMKTCGSPGEYVWVSYNPDPKRKLKYTWEYTETSDGLIGVNTSRPNAIVAAALLAGIVPELRDFPTLKREVKYGKNSRIDILASTNDNSKKCYIEVKNTTLLHEDGVAFPDAVTERGLKHLQELSQMVKDGSDAVAFFLVNRPEGRYFKAAAHIDAKWSAGLVSAMVSGVQVLTYRSQNFVDGARLGEKISLVL